MIEGVIHLFTLSLSICPDYHCLFHHDYPVVIIIVFYFNTTHLHVHVKGQLVLRPQGVRQSRSDFCESASGALAAERVADL
jgi:hypothetical protein